MSPSTPRMPPLSLPPSTASDDYMRSDVASPILDFEYREPARVSFWTLLCVDFIGTVTFVVVIPLSNLSAITARFLHGFVHGKKALAINGALIAASSLSSCLMSMPMTYMYDRGMPLKRMLVIMAACGTVGSVAFGVGGILSSGWILFSARVIQGLFAGPLSLVTFISRSTGVRHRSSYMLFATISTTLGLMAGPLLAFFLDGAFVTNKHAAQGWVMAALNVIALVLVVGLFQEPLEDPASSCSPQAEQATQCEMHGDSVGAVAQSKSKLPMVALSVCFFITFVLQSCQAAWFTFTMVFLKDELSTSAKVICFCISGLMLLLLPVSWLGRHLGEKVRDRTATAVLLPVASLGWLLMYDYSTRNDFWLYMTGSLWYLGCNELARCFIWSLVSKIPMPHRRQAMLGINVVAGLLGKSAGTVLGALAGRDSLAVVMVGAHAIVSITLGSTYRLLVPYIL